MNHRLFGTLYYIISIAAGLIWATHIIIGNGVRTDVMALAGAAFALGEICAIKHRLGIE